MIQQRAAEANKAALEAEKERDELHNQIEQIEEQLHPKRARTHDAAGDAHEMLAEVENWDLRDHRQQATRVQNRRNVQLGSRQNQAKPRAGTDGFLHHTRLGLVGWIAYWCLGDSADTDASQAPVAMIVNSSELRAAGFDLREVLPLPLQLEAARGGQRTRGATLKQIHGMGTKEVCTFRG